MDDTSVLLYLVSFCATAVIFSLRDGSEVMFYAGFPMLTAAAVSAVTMTCDESFTRRQIRLRIRRKKTSNALLFYRASLWAAGISAIVLFVLFFLLSGFFGNTVLGYSLISPVFRVFAVGICLQVFLGVMRGMLRGIGKEHIARMSIWFQTAVFPVFGIIFGVLGSTAGQKVGVLLRNEGIRAVYCACGIALGFTLSVAISFFVLLVLVSISAGRLRHERNRGDSAFPDDETRGNPEDGRELVRYILENRVPGAVPVLIYLLGMTIGYRLWLNGQSTSLNLVVSRWGGFMGVGFPIVTGCALVSAMPFTSEVRSLSRIGGGDKPKSFYARLSMMLRLSAFVSIPWSAFVFGAAKEIVGIFPNLTFRAEETAVLTLKAGSFQIFLLQTSVLLLLLFWRLNDRRMVIIALSGGFFGQIVLQVILDSAGVGITLSAWSGDLFLLIFLILLYFLGKTDRIRGMRAVWLFDDILTALCSLIAVVPVELLNDYLLRVMPAFPAFLIEFAVFYVLFIVLSIVLKAADLRNMDRIPGGELVRSAAVLLGAAEREEHQDGRSGSL